MSEDGDAGVVLEEEVEIALNALFGGVIGGAVLNDFSGCKGFASFCIYVVSLFALHTGGLGLVFDAANYAFWIYDALSFRSIKIVPSGTLSALIQG